MFLKTLELKRTQNNREFLQYILVKSLKNPMFDFSLIESLLNHDEYDSSFYITKLEYLFSKFGKFVYIHEAQSIFLSFKNTALLYEKNSVISYQNYVFRTKKLFKNNIFSISEYKILNVEKILKEKKSSF
ncbi:hypothetical protein CWI38_0031p0050 [Hamiltosporidium tvaerminnensis]|uniref:Uncharacterized protein n=1 Tax=Hamiltosporidium tvaerminnensis TaxID=1176355 RepID=A0A4Q9M1Z6_9MICR|nr:hypothetical protein CWI38_0031p0050 [Hamiltosporidium tvaerminnensis]